MKADEILNKAAGLVGGDRAKSHGDKVTNHANIAHIWNAILWMIDPKFPGLSPRNVADMMEGLKIARRYAGEYNPDDYVDGAGYAGVAGEIAARGLTFGTPPSPEALFHYGQDAAEALSRPAADVHTFPGAKK